MGKPMTENSKKIFVYLRDNMDKDLTAADVAAALDLDKRKVDGSFTSWQKKGWGVRVPAEVENADGTHTAIKLLKLTDVGVTIDPDDMPETPKAAE